MNTKELAKILSEKGLTPEQITKLVERWEKQKERVKEYQRRKYYKVSVSVRKDAVEKVSKLTGIPESVVKKYLAAVKVFRSIPQDQKEKIKQVLNQGIRDF